jgi:carbon monoxide dehydrogenase subunit G
MAYELEVPVGRAALWPAFTDPESMARAVPGLTVDAVQPVDPAGSPAGVSGDVVAGRLRLKVGTGTVTYRGTATIADADPAAGTLDVAIDVAQARGSGALAGYLRIALRATDGGTLVSVVPDLELSGRVAEFRPEDLHASVGALASAWVTALAGRVADVPVAEEARSEEPKPEEPKPEEPKPEVVAEIEAVAVEVAEVEVVAEPEPEAEAEPELAAETEPVAEPEPAQEPKPEVVAELEAAVAESESGDTGVTEEHAAPAPPVDDSLSDDPLERVWRGEYDKNPWVPVVVILTVLLILRRRRGKRRLMS